MYHMISWCYIKYRDIITVIPSRISSIAPTPHLGWNTTLPTKVRLRPPRRHGRYHGPRTTWYTNIDTNKNYSTTSTMKVLNNSVRGTPPTFLTCEGDPHNPTQTRTLRYNGPTTTWCEILCYKHIMSVQRTPQGPRQIRQGGHSILCLPTSKFKLRTPPKHGR